VSRSIIRRWKRNLINAPFYKNLLLTKQPFPVITKTEFMHHFDSINTVAITKKKAFEVSLKSEVSRDFSPSINGISVGLSTGTSGNRGIFLTNQREREMWVGMVLERVIGLSLHRRKVAFFLRANNNLYESIKSKLLQFHFFDIRTSITLHFEHLVALQADILVAQPSVILELSKEYKRTHTTPRFSKIISVAEVLEEDQKIYFKNFFNCPIDQVYQCTEGFLAHTCRLGNLHFNEDFLHIEKKYLDSQKKRFHPIITDYLRYTQPVVRYELNDIIHQGAACSCGLKSTVIAKIEGRLDDVFRFTKEHKEVIIYPDFLRRAVVTAAPHAYTYRVSQVSNSLIYFYLETEDESKKQESISLVTNALTELLHDYDLTDIQVTYNHYEHITATKFKRISNDYTSKIQN
jgi:putative adenylate-forming enzyme